MLRNVDIVVAGGGSDLLANSDDVLVPGDVAIGPYPRNVTDGAVSVRLTPAQLTDIRAAVVRIPLQGMRSPESALRDQ